MTREELEKERMAVENRIIVLVGLITSEIERFKAFVGEKAEGINRVNMAAHTTGHDIHVTAYDADHIEERRSYPNLIDLWVLDGEVVHRTSSDERLCGEEECDG